MRLPLLEGSVKFVAKGSFSMGEFVYAAAMSHAPGIAAFPEAPALDQRQRFMAAADVARRALEVADVDILIVVAPDHFTNFFVDNMPAFCVGFNEEYYGPTEDWLGLKARQVKGSPSVARDIAASALEHGIDLSFSETMKLEHSVMVPLTLLMPNFDIPIIWIMLNCQVPPMPTLKRCWELGHTLRLIIEARPERFGIVGTGGLSHFPGSPEMGDIDQEFDRDFLQKVEANDVNSLVSMSKDHMDAAGFGAWEIRQWLTIMGAVPDRQGLTLAYEAIPEWETGCAVTLFR
jgi:aromatic ring-opening dioxygenase catalytic subunit (LigB family)